VRNCGKQSVLASRRRPAGCEERRRLFILAAVREFAVPGPICFDNSLLFPDYAGGDDFLSPSSPA